MANILTHIIQQQTSRYGRERTALTTIDVAGKRLIPCSWGELNDRVERAACAMVALGIEPQQTVAIIAPNCPDIVVTDFASYRCRAIPVSIYATSSAEQIRYIVNDAGARILFVGTGAHYTTARSIAAECPTLEHIVVYDGNVAVADAERDMTFDAFLALGERELPRLGAKVALLAAAAIPDDIATLIYTSGTTGEPKGAILPHRCFDAAIDMHKVRLDTLTDDETSVCFLPLSHIFEKAWTYFCLTLGIRVDINTNPKEIQKAILIAKPNCMCSVPRFWEKVYSAVQEKISSTRGVTKIMFERALAAGAKRNLEYVRLGRRVPWLLERRYQFYNRTVFARLRAAIGIEDGRFFPTAGAPLSAAIVEFLHACGINIVIGYGLSETTATVTCFPTIGYEIGTVGTPLSGDVQIRIGENNEIQVKGPTVMQGYFGRPDTDNSVFTADGWFRTGDAGRFDESGSLILTERIKDLFKTSNGKYIAPQAIESRLGEDRYIEQVAVIGDQRKYVTAFIVPAFEALKEYARSKGIRFESIDDLVNNEDIRAFIAERIEKLQKGLAGFEKIKKFTLLPREFSIEAGELTNTLKIRRPVINSAYADEIEAMYC